MLDRQKIESVLIRRFPGATHVQFAAAANAIMGLEDEWEEIPGRNMCRIGREVPHDEISERDVRLFRRRAS